MNFKKQWRKLVNNGVREDLGFEQVSRIRISNIISLVGSLFAFGYAVYLSSQSQYLLALYDILFVINLLLIFLFNYLGYYRLGPIILFITIPISLLLVNHHYGHIGTEYYYFGMIVFAFYYFEKSLNRYLIASYLVLFIIISKIIEDRVEISAFAASVEPVILVINLIMSFVILVLSVSLFVNEHTRNKQEIEQKNAQLSHALYIANNRNDQINMLLKEQNHRVKNNLQIITSLFNLQAYKSISTETRSAIIEARNRIASISIVHNKLYKDNFTKEVSLKKYINLLIDHFIKSFDDYTVHTQQYVDDITLSIEDTIHVGLIVNELASNAFKYGANTQNGKVEFKIAVNFADNSLRIHFSDSGKGFPDNFSINSLSTVGYELINGLVKQHEGSINVYSNKGAHIDITLKIPEFRD